MNMIINEREDMTAGTAWTQRVTRDYYDKVHASQRDHLEERGTFLYDTNKCKIPGPDHGKPEQTNNTYGG